MYADDTSVTCSAEDIDTLCDDLRTELTNISEWMRQNNLSINANKSEFLIVGHKRQLISIHEPEQLKVDEEPIRRVQTVKHLGLRIDEKLSCNEQCRSLKSKVKLGLSSIHKLKGILPQTKLEQVYRALVESHIRYDNELWGSSSDTKLSHLQRLQDRARSLIESYNIKDGWTCNWLSVSILIKYDKAVMACKVMNNLCPNSLQGKFTTRSQISAYATRNCQDFDIPK